MLGKKPVGTVVYVLAETLEELLSIFGKKF